MANRTVTQQCLKRKTDVDADSITRKLRHRSTKPQSSTGSDSYELIDYETESEASSWDSLSVQQPPRSAALLAPDKTSYTKRQSKCGSRMVLRTAQENDAKRHVRTTAPYAHTISSTKAAVATTYSMAAKPSREGYSYEPYFGHPTKFQPAIPFDHATAGLGERFNDDTSVEDYNDLPAELVLHDTHRNRILEWQLDMYHRPFNGFQHS